MSVSLTLAATLTAVETLGVNTASASDANRKVTHDQFNQSQALTGASNVPVSKCAYFEQALTAGAASIDLTALTGTNGGAVNGTGLKVQAILIKNKSTNSNVMTFAVGASNGYNLAGAGWSEALLPGQWTLKFLNEAAPDVAAGAKTLDIAGTGAEVAQIGIVLG